jgi:hypothetical protein
MLHLNNNIYFTINEYNKLDNNIKSLYPFYCPKEYPYFCGKNSNSFGLCKKQLEDCDNVNIDGVIPTLAIDYIDINKGTKFGYHTENLHKRCNNIILNKEEIFNNNFLLPSMLSIMTYNIWGLPPKNDFIFKIMKIRINLIVNIILKNSPDIICFQEVSLISFNILKKRLSYIYKYQYETNYYFDEILKRNRENELEKESRKILREKLRFQEERLRIIEDEREIKDEIKRKRIEEKEKLARETSEIIETNKKQVLEFNEYLKTIQSFHTRSSDDFNWNCYTEKPDFLSLLNKNVKKIKFFSGCENLKILKEKHYPTYIAFTNGGANVIKCLSNFSLRLETNCDVVLVRKTNFDFSIFTAFLNNKDLTFLFENHYENKIERVENHLKEIKNKIEEYSEKIYDIKYQKTEYETEINKTNWISGLFENKKSKLIENIKSLEIKVNNITKELEEIENGSEFYNLNKIHNEYNDYLETLQTIDIIWNESINIFKEQKELYYLSNNLLENKDYQFFEIAEKIFEPFSFVNELNIRSVSNYQNEIHSMDVYLEGRNIVPEEESYLVRDKELKTREFSKKRFWEIYQDYVSSITLRVAKEYFSFFLLEAQKRRFRYICNYVLPTNLL